MHRTSNGPYRVPIALSSFARGEGKICERNYLKKLEVFERWLGRRYLRLGQVNPSDLVDVRDTEGIWCPAVVKDIIKIGQSRSLLVHYIGWSSLYD